MCEDHKFLVDGGVTANSAQILRVPETLNFKDINNPKPVEVISQKDNVDLSFIEGILKAEVSIFDELKNKNFSRQLDATTLALQANYKNTFIHTIYTCTFFFVFVKTTTLTW